MKKNLNKLATLALTGILMTGMSFGSLAAAIGRTGAVDEVDDARDLTFVKELKLTDVDSDAVPTVPAVKFTYSISAATQNATISREVNSVERTFDVYAPELNGVTGEPTVKDVEFKKNSTVSNGIASENVEVSFKDVEFAKPGIYRWIIKETGRESTEEGITYDTAIKTLGEHYDERYLDVYVVRDGESYKVKGYVLYKEEKAGDEEAKTDGYRNEKNVYGDDEAIKSSEYRTYDVTVTKTVSGAMASHDKLFHFNSVFTNVGAEEKLTVSGGSNPTKSESGHDYGYDLKHNETYTIKGIPFDATSTLTEEDYSVDGYSIKTVTGAGATGEARVYDVVNNNKNDSATAVTVTNELVDIPVTGVVMNIAPYAAMILGAGAFAGVFLGRKKSEDEE